MTSRTGSRRSIRSNESGFVLITGAMSCITLLAFLGLAVDVGYLETEKLRAQTAADAAAAGAAVALSKGGNAAAVTAAGQYDSALNGITNGTNSATVTINNPPLSGYYTTGNSYVEAIVTQPTSTYFMRVVGLNSVNVTARSVAKAGSAAGCIYVLSPTAAKAFTMNGAFNTTTACGALVNSDATNATYNTGTGAISFTGASNVSLTAPTTGAYAGILFYQDPSDTAAATVTGAANADYVGVLYFPNAALDYAGASNGAYTILVAQTLAVVGAANIGDNYSSLPGGSPVHDNGGVTFGRLFYAATAITGAARAGIEYGIQGKSESTDYTGMQTQAVAAAPNITGVTAVATQFCKCSDNSAKTCTSGCAGMNTYLKVTVAGQYSLLSTYMFFTQTIPITAVSITRFS